MLLVFLSHFAQVFFGETSRGRIPNMFWRVGLMASPTFVIISGTLLGFLYAQSAEEFGPVQSNLIDRGLFLVTVGHALILGALLQYGHTARWLFMTDAIGISLIVGSLFVRRIGPSGRVVLGMMVYATSWLALELYIAGRGLGGGAERDARWQHSSEVLRLRVPDPPVVQRVPGKLRSR